MEIALRHAVWSRKMTVIEEGGEFISSKIYFFIDFSLFICYLSCQEMRRCLFLRRPGAPRKIAAEHGVTSTIPGLTHTIGETNVTG
jgi:hypothetical protein